MTLARDQVLSAIKAKSVGYARESCEMIDSRDYVRLIEWFPSSDLIHFGFTLNDDDATWDVKPWTDETLQEQFVRDLEFAWEKASDERGISASLMFEVVQMWMWIFEDEEMLGLPYYGYGQDSLLRIARKHNVPLAGIRFEDDGVWVKRSGG